MTSPGHRREPGDSHVGDWVADAYATRVSLDTAARHLWSVDREARRLARRRRRQRLATTAASVVLLLAGVGTVAGSATAVPGEVLYPVKDGLERAELSMAVSQTAHARAHVRHSRARLEELRHIAESDPHLVPEVAGRFYDSLARAADSGGQDVATQVAALRNEAAVLMDRLVRDLEPSIARSLAAVDGVPDSVAAVLPVSTGGGGTVQAGPADLGADGGSGGPAGGDTGSPAADPVVTPPETAVAETDPSDPDGGSSQEGAAVITPIPESSAAVSEPAPESDTVETPPETSTSPSDPQAGSDGGEDVDGSNGAASSPGSGEAQPDEPSPTTPVEGTPESVTSETSTSASSQEGSGDGGEDGSSGPEP